jgi:hypothetical protein
MLLELTLAMQSVDGCMAILTMYPFCPLDSDWSLVFVRIGAILEALHPTTPLCVAQPYFIYLG